MRRIRALLMLSVAAVLMVSCTSSEPPAGAIGGQQPSPEGRQDTGQLRGRCRNTGDEQPVIEDYRDDLSIAFEGILRDPEVRSPAPDDGEYRAIVHKYRQDGLDALSDDERVSLLLAAQGAFLANACSLRFSIVSEGAAGSEGQNGGGQAVAEELYPYPAVLGIVRRHMTGSGIAWPWGELPRSESISPYDILQFFGHRPEDGGALSLTTWEWQHDRWVCSVASDAHGVLQIGLLGHIKNFSRYALGEFIGPDQVEGRQALRFEARGEDLTYWLDAQTLWVRQYEFHDSSGATITVKLEAVNEDIRIEPPDADVKCVGEQPSGEGTPVP
jgi:hypothetical protein